MLSTTVRGRTVLGGVKKSIIRCEYILKLGVFCIALVSVVHKEA